MPAGRPSDYSTETAEVICDRIADGQSIADICADDAMPHRRTVYRWLENHPEFATRYARAREIQGDHMDDLILRTAKDCTPANFQAAKVQIGAYQWRAEKLKSRVYGNRTAVEHSGPGGAPITTVALVTADPVEAAKEYQRLLSGEG